MEQEPRNTGINLKEPKLTIGESGQVYVNEEVFDEMLGRNTERIVGLWEGEDPSGSDTANENHEGSI